jgi:hypothetical protein
MKTGLGGRHRGRPATIEDFDPRLTLHNLKNHSDSARQCQWINPRWQHYLFAVFLVIASGRSTPPSILQDGRLA